MPSVKQTAEYFDKHAEGFRSDRLVNKWKAVSVLFEDLPTGARILECGAGTGLYTMPLLQAGFRVVAVDLSEKSLRQIDEKAHSLGLTGRLETICGDFATLAEQTTEPFDAVSFIKVLHHFPDRKSIRQGIALGYGLLKPQGMLLGFEPNGSFPLWGPWIRRRGPEVWESEKNILLMRRSLFESVFRTLPAASWSFSYRYLIPRSIVNRLSILDPLDRLATRTPLLKRISTNILLRVRRCA